MIHKAEMVFAAVLFLLGAGAVELLIWFGVGIPHVHTITIGCLAVAFWFSWLTHVNYKALRQLNRMPRHPNVPMPTFPVFPDNRKD